MIDVFFNAVLPVFAVVAVGFAFGRGGLFDFPAALALNRFVFYAALPLLFFRLIATSPFARFDWLLVLAFLLAELILYAMGYVVARHIFGRSWSESLLLGMSVAFANQVFFVLPIARQLYGDTGAIPVVAVSTLEIICRNGERSCISAFLFYWENDIFGICQVKLAQMLSTHYRVSSGEEQIILWALKFSDQGIEYVNRRVHSGHCVRSVSFRL